MCRGRWQARTLGGFWFEYDLQFMLRVTDPAAFRAADMLDAEAYRATASGTGIPTHELRSNAEEAVAAEYHDAVVRPLLEKYFAVWYWDNGDDGAAVQVHEIVQSEGGTELWSRQLHHKLTRLEPARDTGYTVNGCEVERPRLKLGLWDLARIKENFQMLSKADLERVGMDPSAAAVQERTVIATLREIREFRSRVSGAAFEEPNRVAAGDRAVEVTFRRMPDGNVELAWKFADSLPALAKGGRYSFMGFREEGGFGGGQKVQVVSKQYSGRALDDSSIDKVSGSGTYYYTFALAKHEAAGERNFDAVTFSIHIPPAGYLAEIDRMLSRLEKAPTHVVEDEVSKADRQATEKLQRAIGTLKIGRKLRTMLEEHEEFKRADPELKEYLRKTILGAFNVEGLKESDFTID